jgi:beta-lactamase regulating signal transducer with metallopeptidase domain
MDTFHATSAVFADWLLETTVHVAVLFALVFGTCTLLGKRLTARWRHALWALVLVRLMLPALPSSPASVHNVVPDAPRTVATVWEPSAPAVPRNRQLDPDSLSRLVPAASSATAVSVPAAQPWPWRTTLAIVWVAGAALALGRLLLTEARFARRVRRESEWDDPRVRTALADVLAAARVRRRVRVVRTDLGGGPALTGVLTPRILVPAAVLDRLSDDELRHVLAHEVAHLAAGDVLQNWLLALLEGLHWFNPLVRVAGARVRAERETLRDLAATRGAPQESRAAYGRTLLRLLETGARPAAPRMAVGLFERRGDLRRRIEMIAKGSGGRRAWMLGAGLTAVVAAVALTGASSDPVQAGEDTGGTVVDGDGEPVDGAVIEVSWNDAKTAAPAFSQSGPRIEVVRRSEPPEWKARVDAALAKKTSVHLQETPVVEFLEYMSQVTGLNVVIHPDAQEDATELMITLQLEDISSGQALRLALRQVEMTYGLVDGVVHVGSYGQIRPLLDQRFYKIAPIVDAMVERLSHEFSLDTPEAYREDEEAFRNSVPEDIIAVSLAFAADQDSWSRTGVSMAMWGDVIVVEQDEAGHADLVPPVPAWRSSLEEKLATRVSFDFQDAKLADVLAYLAQVSETSIVVATDVEPDRMLTLKLTDVSTLDAVNWVGRQTGLHAAFSDGVVVLTHAPPTVVRAYDVTKQLVTPQGGTYDALVELIVTSVAPVSWEDFGMIEVFDGMLIVKNTESVHAQIEEFLEVARRAKDR